MSGKCWSRYYVSLMYANGELFPKFQLRNLANDLLLMVTVLTIFWTNGLIQNSVTPCWSELILIMAWILSILILSYLSFRTFMGLSFSSICFCAIIPVNRCWSIVSIFATSWLRFGLERSCHSHMVRFAGCCCVVTLTVS